MEVSLSKLVLASLLLIVIPAIMLGLAPLVASAWVSKISASITSPLNMVWPVLVLLALIAVAWIGGCALFRLAESSFWSVNLPAVGPGYVAFREVLRHIVEGVLRTQATQSELAKLRAATAAVAGFALSILAISVFILAWPSSRWVVDISALTS